MLCDDVNVLTADQPCEEGCPILNKSRTVLAEKGVCATIEWVMRDRQGNAVDLSGCFPESSASVSAESVSVSESSVSASASDAGSVVVRFAGCDQGGDIYEVTGSVQDASAGKVRFAPPAEVMGIAGIYTMSIGIVNSAGAVVLQNTALLSVEPTLFGDTGQRVGPPTVGQLRVHLRDFPQENELLGDYEFDVTEILQAIVRPVQQWNETPPPVARFSCSNFPFKFHWQQAIVGELLRTAAHSYMRNEYQAEHGGIRGNLKAKHRQYMEISELYATEWRRFVKAKKVEINAGMAMGSLGSSYEVFY